MNPQHAFCAIRSSASREGNTVRIGSFLPFSVVPKGAEFQSKTYVALADCRRCGVLCCDDCSNYKLKVGDKNERACKTCWDDYKETERVEEQNRARTDSDNAKYVGGSKACTCAQRVGAKKRLNERITASFFCSFLPQASTSRGLVSCKTAPSRACTRKLHSDTVLCITSATASAHSLHPIRSGRMRCAALHFLDFLQSLAIG